MKKLYKTIIVLLLFPILGFANDDAIITKQKTSKKPLLSIVMQELILLIPTERCLLPLGMKTRLNLTF